MAVVATPVALVSADLRGRRFHVVRRGESLWSIASALLEPGASASSIAHQVRRLWRLNEDRIGTGDPSLLRIGVKLRLR
jgi:Tfp pilus assembly protein FimV